MVGLLFSYLSGTICGSIGPRKSTEEHHVPMYIDSSFVWSPTTTTRDNYFPINPTFDYVENIKKYDTFLYIQWPSA